MRLRRLHASSGSANGPHAEYKGAYKDTLENCAICLDPIHHLSIVMVCDHGYTAHAVHQHCGERWYRNAEKGCAQCRAPCDRISSQLAYYPRIQVSVISHGNTSNEAMDAVLGVARKVASIYESKGVKISTDISKLRSRSMPEETARVGLSLAYPASDEINISLVWKDHMWHLSQDGAGKLVFMLKDEKSHVVIGGRPLVRRPSTFVSVTDLLMGRYLPDWMDPHANDELHRQLKANPGCAIELNGSYYSLRVHTFPLERESAVEHVASTLEDDGLGELPRDESVQYTKACQTTLPSSLATDWTRTPLQNGSRSTSYTHFLRGR